MCCSVNVNINDKACDAEQSFPVNRQIVDGNKPLKQQEYLAAAYEASKELHHRLPDLRRVQLHG